MKDLLKSTQEKKIQKQAAIETASGHPGEENRESSLSVQRWS